MSIKTLELEIERLKIQKELSEQRHKQRMEELKIKKEIAELEKEHFVTKRFASSTNRVKEENEGK